jgi:hypothetical protein
MRIQVSGNSFQFQSFHPGTWYWKVENDAGTSEIRKFVIEKPIRRNVMLAQPQNGGSLSGNGGVVSWQGDYGIAFYRVELSTNGSWGAPQYRFATSGTELQLQGVQPGQYQMRVGAFSEVARRWEYQDAVTISVQ